MRYGVILCAGALGSPHILQHSGVGDAGHLRSLGVPVVADVPEVGRNLHDHVFGHVKFRLTDESDSLNVELGTAERIEANLERWRRDGSGPLNTTSSQTLAFFSTDPSRSAPDVQLAMRPLSFGIGEDGQAGIDPFPGMIVSAIAAQPASRGRVRITSAEPRERPSVDPNYLADPCDIEALVAGIHRVRQIVAHPRSRTGSRQSGSRVPR